MFSPLFSILALLSILASGVVLAASGAGPGPPPVGRPLHGGVAGRSSGSSRAATAGPVTASASVSVSSAVVAAIVSKLDLHSGSTNTSPIQTSDRILGISWILHLNKRESRRIPGNPDVLDGAVLAERVLQVILVGVVPQAADKHLAVGVPVPSHSSAAGTAMRV